METTAQKADRLVAKIVTLKSNPHYRMADVFYSRGFRFQDSAEKVLALPEFDGTILKTYLIENGGYESQNLPLLLEILRRIAFQKSYPSPAEDELVIHVRAGDVVQHDWFLKEDLVAKVAGFPVRKCSLAICFAFQEWVERGWWLFSEEKLQTNITMVTTVLEKLINSHPAIDFDVVSNRDVDRDLVYMVMARHFVRDQGGFSDLICDLRSLETASRTGSV